MFDQLKMMGAVAGLLKNRDQIKAAGDRIQERLEAMQLRGASEGDLVRVVVSGKMNVSSVQIAPALAMGMGKSDKDRALGEQLIAEAVNAALSQAQQAVAEVIDEEGSSLGLPGLGEQLRQILPR
jgi:DNA-binding protein YbaB